MSNALTVLAGAPPAIVNQRKSLFNSAAQANVQASFAVLSFKGKVWRIKYRGEETTPMVNGLPLQALDVVVVGVASSVSKQWYGKKFSEGDDAAPDCFSVNGTTPDQSSPKKQANTCAVCPMNQWGSRVSDTGSKGKACQDNRRIAIVPDGDLANDRFGGPVMLRLPPTTLATFAQYGATLEKRGAGMEYVVTRIVFDHTVAYPKLVFQPLRWLTQDEALQIVGPDGQGGLCAEPQIERMLNEAVEEVTHDPASIATGAAHDPLAAGGPAPVFAQPVVVPVQPVSVAVQPTVAPQPAGFGSAAPSAAAAGFGAAAAQPAANGFGAPAAAAPAASGFGAPATAAVQAHAPVQAAPVQHAAPVTNVVPLTPPVIAQANVVQAAPSDLEGAIDALLNAPI